MRRKFQHIALALVAVLLAGSFQLQAQTKKRGTPKPPTQSKNGLQEMASKSGGHFVLRYQPRVTLYPNLEELAKRSDLIVVGRVLGRKSKLRDDGNFINQDVLVRVQEVLKGEPGGKSVVLTMPGGSYRFADGNYASVEPIGQALPELQNFYVFFLKTPGKGRGLELASETQGFFGFAGDSVQPASLSKDNPLVEKYGKLGAADFFRELHQAVPRKVASGAKK